MNANQLARLQNLNKAYEARWAILGTEKRNDLAFSDPIIDKLAHEMFLIISNGTDHITLTPEWVEENAEK